jgi:hypothetical protein
MLEGEIVSSLCFLFTSDDFVSKAAPVTSGFPTATNATFTSESREYQELNKHRFHFLVASRSERISNITGMDHFIWLLR